MDGRRYVSPLFIIAQAVRAILLASATATSLRGLRSSSARNQSVICRLPGLMAALITEVAPETSNTRSRSLPARLMPPIRCLPPVERSFGVRPAQAARWRPDSNIAGSISTASVNAVTGPTPGMVTRRWLTSLALCAAVSLASISLIRASIASICWPRRANISLASGGMAASCSIAESNGTDLAELPCRR